MATHADIRIPVYRPRLAGRESQYVNDCLATGWISSRGEYVARFEREFAEYTGIRHATSVANGTVALQLAMWVLGIGAGDEVIVPTFTYVASVNVIAAAGATPVFVDSLADTWQVDPTRIAAAITPRTKAVMVVHLYGGSCDMDPIVALCRERKLLLIEDAAEAFGTRYKGRHVGGFGDIATFSFFGNKTITTGEGGMVVSNRDDVLARAAKVKSQAVSATREYWHDEIGFNYRMTNPCAAIGLAQLEQADAIISRKREIAAWYKADLAGYPLAFQADAADEFNSYWMVSAVAPSGELRDGIRAHLRADGVETRPFFYPAHTLPPFQSTERFPIAESLGQRGLNLPSYPDLSRDDVTSVTTLIKEFMNARD